MLMLIKHALTKMDFHLFKGALAFQHLKKDSQEIVN